MKEFFIIVAICEGEERFFAFDRESGCPYWSQYFNSAKFFYEKSKAEDALRTSDFTSFSNTNDGTVFPPRMIHDGAKVNYAKPKGEVTIQILPIQFGKPVYDVTVKAEIKRGKKP